MRYKDLLRFVERGMRMSHVYQPIMIRALLKGGGRASRKAIARQLLNADESQLEYYMEIVSNMVGRVLTRHGVATRDGQDYLLPGFERLSAEEIRQIELACDKRLKHFLEKRGDAPWEHRRRSAGYVPGSIKYEVLKRAKFRCELCGVAASECALEVDHILPRNRGGDDDLSNLQALCYRCNSMKRDRDDSDLRAVRESIDHRESECVFCDPAARPIIMENRLSIAIADRYPVTEGHLLVIPRRHERDYFQLGSAEVRACTTLLSACRERLAGDDKLIRGFNVGINSGVAAGQTVMHCHIHLIPRREGDVENPRGGVRAVVPGKADYVGPA